MTNTQFEHLAKQILRVVGDKLEFEKATSVEFDDKVDELTAEATVQLQGAVEADKLDEQILSCKRELNRLDKLKQKELEEISKHYPQLHLTRGWGNVENVEKRILKEIRRQATEDLGLKTPTLDEVKGKIALMDFGTSEERSKIAETIIDSFIE